MASREPLVPREELQAAVEARRELGREREPDVIDSFLERVETRLDRRIAERLPQRRDDRGHEQRRFVLGIISVLFGIPLTAIALGTSGLAALIVVWAGIVLVNVAFARSR